LGDDEYFDEVVELVKAIFDPISEMQPEYEETIELSFPITYSSAFGPPNLISESKWVGVIHWWPKASKEPNDWMRKYRFSDVKLLPS
jgi:hypothetical protein